MENILHTCFLYNSRQFNMSSYPMESASYSPGEIRDLSFSLYSSRKLVNRAGIFLQRSRNTVPSIQKGVVISNDPKVSTVPKGINSKRIPNFRPATIGKVMMNA